MFHIVQTIGKIFEEITKIFLTFPAQLKVERLSRLDMVKIKRNRPIIRARNVLIKPRMSLHAAISTQNMLRQRLTPSLK